MEYQQNRMKPGKEQMEISSRKRDKSGGAVASGQRAANSGDWLREEPPSLHGLVVSIHDVCPATRAVTEKMLADLAAVGVNRTSLLVIPNRHRRDPAFTDADFCAWLKACVRAGHELVLHGYYHERVARHELRGVERIVATNYTAGEGEFFDLSPVEALESLARGLREMEEAMGIPPSGFIAPAWLLGPEARRALQEFSFSYTTLLQGVWDLRESIYYPSQSLCYSVRAPWRRGCSLLWNSTLLAWLYDAPLVRLGLHPPDWNFPRIRQHALTCVERALVGRPAMTYASWVDQQRRQTLSVS
jgi:predicted deacetylase